MEKTTEISIAQSKFTVDCPRWLQRRMLKNLQAAARSRINPARAKRASQILDAVDKEDTRVDSLPANIAVSKNTQVEAIKDATKITQSWAARLWNSFASLVSKLICTFTKQRFCFERGIGEVTTKNI